MAPISSDRRRIANLTGFLACAALMAYALYAQYALHLEPCPLCIFQRIAVIALGVIFLIAALHGPRRRAPIYAVLIGCAAAAGIAVAARHLWIQAQPPGTVAACGASLSYMLDILPLREVIAKVLSGSGECAEINWRFPGKSGLSMPAWVLASLVLLGGWGLVVNLRRVKPPGLSF